MWRDSRQIEVSLLPEGAYRYSGAVYNSSGRVGFRGGVLRLGVVNDSSRSVSIVSGRLLFDGEPLGSVARVIADSRLLSSPVLEGRIEGSPLYETGQPLPFQVPPGGGIPLAVVWAPSSLATAMRFSQVASPPNVSIGSGGPPPGDYKLMMCPGGRPSFRVLDPKPPRPSPTPSAKSTIPPTIPSQLRPVRGRLRLELELKPGGRHSVQIVLQPSPARRDREKVSVLALSEAPGWSVYVQLAGSRIAWLYLVSELPVGSLGTAKLTLWGRPAFSRELTRPRRQGVAATCFPLGRLRDGRYEWAVQAGGATVASGEFRTPCPASRQRLARANSMYGLPASVCEPLLPGP